MATDRAVRVALLVTELVTSSARSALSLWVYDMKTQLA
jgi:hypothetical protein